MAAARRFEWDEANIGHVQRHGIAPEEAEQVLGNKPFVIRIERRNGERRIACLGQTGRAAIWWLCTRGVRTDIEW